MRYLIDTLALMLVLGAGCDSTPTTARSDGGGAGDLSAATGSDLAADNGDLAAGGADDGSTGDATVLGADGAADGANPTSGDLALLGADDGPVGTIVTYDLRPASCGADNSPCTLGSTNGLCKAGSCSTCVPWDAQGIYHPIGDYYSSGSPDDVNCAAAYGAGTVCSDQGACVPGECHWQELVCPGAKLGQLCGLNAPYQCSPCANDSQCAGCDFDHNCDLYCNLTTHTCLSPAGCDIGNPTTACGTGHICCTLPGPINDCKSGNCCTNTQCGGTAATACTNFQCTATGCGTVAAAGTIFVDPVGGNDATASGTATCKFKSITAAMQLAGSLASSTISVPAGTVIGSLETFPIIILANTKVVGSGVTKTQIQAPVKKTVFRMSAAGAGLSNFEILGRGKSGAGTPLGVLVDSGSSTTTTIDHLYVHDTLTGIEVAGSGRLTLGDGTRVEGNVDGLYVAETAAAALDLSGSPTQAADFNGNKYGIEVYGGGAVKLYGVLKPTASITNVSASNNSAAGILIAQTPLNAPTCDVQGVTANGNLGDGMQISAGSKVVLRNNVVYANYANGIAVLPGADGTTTNTSTIDLGSTFNGDSNSGRNTLQGWQMYAGTFNGGAGVCINFGGATGTMLAKDNIWHDAIDCQSLNGLNFGNSCSHHVDVAFANSPAFDIAIDQCFRNP